MVEIHTTMGASGAVSGGLPELPKCMNTGSPVSWAAAKNGSQWSVWNDGRPNGVVASGNVMALAPLAAQRCHLRRRQGGVPQRRDDHRDEAFGLGARPLVDDEVVVGLHAQQRQVPVLALQEQRATEAGERREAQLRPHPVDVHVLHTLRGVVAAGQDLVEPVRLETEVLRVLVDDRVEGELRVLAPLVEPEFLRPGYRVAVLVGGVEILLDDAGAGLAGVRGQPVLEDPRVLDHVVVDRDDLHVVLQWHAPPSGTGAVSGGAAPERQRLNPSARRSVER